MDLPSSLAQFVALVLVALPGITYATVRNRARGRAASTTSLASKVGEGIAAGLFFDLLYVLILGEALIDAFTPRNNTIATPRAAAAYALVLGIAIPAAVAWLLHRGSRWRRPTQRGAVNGAADALVRCRDEVRGWVAAHLGTVEPAFNAMPTAWDFALPRRGGKFVRIVRADGERIGGWFGGRSVVSKYPEERDIFVQVQWRLDDQGHFVERIDGSDGFWYSVQPGDRLEWLDPPGSDGGGPGGGGVGGAQSGGEGHGD